MSAEIQEIPVDKELVQELRLLLEASKGTPAAWAASQIVIWAYTPRYMVSSDG